MPTPRNYMKSSNRTTTNRYNNKTTTTRIKKTPTFTKNSPAFKRVRMECEKRIGSYRSVYTQFTGAGVTTPFSPTLANKWVKYVNNGWHVYYWSNKDFCKHFGTQWNNGTPTACYRWMKQKYGSCIKAITRGKGTSWLVAVTPNITARPFNNYNWK